MILKTYVCSIMDDIFGVSIKGNTEQECDLIYKFVHEWEIDNFVLYKKSDKVVYSNSEKVYTLLVECYEEEKEDYEHHYVPPFNVMFQSASFEECDRLFENWLRYENECRIRAFDKKYL